MLSPTITGSHIWCAQRHALHARLQSISHVPPHRKRDLPLLRAAQSQGSVQEASGSPLKSWLKQHCREWPADLTPSPVADRGYVEYSFHFSCWHGHSRVKVVATNRVNSSLRQQQSAQEDCLLPCSPFSTRCPLATYWTQLSSPVSLKIP